MVSRETLITEGADRLGVELDTPTLARLVMLSDLLVDRAIPRGLLAQGERDRVLPRHLLEALALVRWLPQGAYIDVGSGAGLPGLVLACVRSGPSTLVEVQGRRAGFLREAVHALDLTVEVVQDRVEAVCRSDRREGASAVTARALAPIAEALELIVPLCAVEGVIAIPVGELTSTELAQAGAAADALGGAAPRLERFEVPGATESRWAMIVRKLRSTPDRYPRLPGPRRRLPAGGDVV